jgi:hypothetical protein
MNHENPRDAKEVRRPTMRGLRSAAVAATVLLTLAGSPPRPAWAAPMHEDAAPRAAALDAATLESTYGIRITKIAVTGGGGLVDVRFTVLDPVKARPILEHGSRPRLVAVDGGAVLEAPAHGLMRNVRLQKDAACFLLYPNARNAIQAGTRVALAFGDVKAEPVVAQ